MQIIALLISAAIGVLASSKSRPNSPRPGQSGPSSPRPGQTFSVETADKTVIKDIPAPLIDHMKTVSNMIEDIGGLGAIPAEPLPLPNCPDKQQWSNFRTILDLTTGPKVEAHVNTAGVTQDGYLVKIMPLEKLTHESDASIAKNDQLKALKAYYDIVSAPLASMSKADVIELIKFANYLDSPNVLNVALKYVASTMRDKSVDQIMDYWKMPAGGNAPNGPSASPSTSPSTPRKGGDSSSKNKRNDATGERTKEPESPRGEKSKTPESPKTPRVGGDSNKSGSGGGSKKSGSKIGGN